MVEGKVDVCCLLQVKRNLESHVNALGMEIRAKGGSVVLLGLLEGLHTPAGWHGGWPGLLPATS